MKCIKCGKITQRTDGYYYRTDGSVCATCYEGDTPQRFIYNAVKVKHVTSK